MSAITRRLAGTAGLLCAALLLVSRAQGQTEDRPIAFTSLDPARAVTVSGVLRMPPGDRPKFPAVIIVHGTGGIDTRGAFHIEKLRPAGFATFEVDFKNGIFSGPSDRPPNDTFLPLAFAALQTLRREPRIDPDRIAIMGFSLGGHLTLTTSLESNRQRWLGAAHGFAAHVAFYPSCKYYLPKLAASAPTGAPLIAFYGSKDAYGDGDACPEVERMFVDRYHFTPTMIRYEGVAHGFDRHAPSVSFYDPAAIDRHAYMEWNEAAALDARTRAVDFLTRTLP